MSDKIIFAIDENLGLNIEDPKWHQFINQFNITILNYSDMKLLTEKMEENTVQLSYLPSGNYFYFHSDPFYKPIANALFCSNDDCKANCVLIVKKESPINSLPELKGKVLGYIHPYCTSSYFAPALLLWKNDFSIHHFFSSLKETGAWQKQIDAVISGEVDATMVLESVWSADPKNQEKTKIIAREGNLPSPLIIYGKSVDKTLLAELEKILFFHKPPALPNALFNGFIPFQNGLVENFFSEATKALAIDSNQEF
ncbi:MAG: PhnD/SsuA/transferrin family substrate-binding protein [Simkaniaceae bacterium]|nr:MAG: PhnD/SsuA/transferrin family substrate-binding protein [Simkaniaceae bacterium]